jgi:glutamyl-tRNA synthetase
MTLRVRFAPSPTGFLHVGGARTALFNWLLARKEQGVFVLRIEDTDRERSTEEHVQAILHGLGWMGLDWDEGPTFQSHGLERHRADVLSLLEAGRAYRDFSSPEEAARDREEDMAAGRRLRKARGRSDARSPTEEEELIRDDHPFAVRFRVPEGETAWDDRVHGPVRFQNAEIDDLVILRSDGTPTYNLAVVSDDVEMGINLVLRGDDHLSNTPKQILLYEALGQPVPSFAHVPLILGPDGRRLSKRHGATAVGDYEKEGILPEAMFNFLAFLGWSPGDDREVFSREELVEVFSIDRVLKKSAVFDLEKLQWMNGQHLARTPTEDLLDQVRMRLADEGLLAEQPSGLGAGQVIPVAGGVLDLAHLVDLLKVRARTLEDLVVQARPYLLDALEFDAKAVRKHWLKDPAETMGLLEGVLTCLMGVEWTEANLEQALRDLAEKMGVGAGKLFQPLRLALTGSSASPGIFDVLALLGRERATKRVKKAIESLRSGDVTLE